MRLLARAFVAFVLITGLGVAALVAGLAWAHRDIRRVDPPLPDLETVARFDPGDDLPVRLAWINTARQAAPRSSVLDASLDPDPDAAYALAHSAFVLEWADGRTFLIDAGMDRETALEFGGPFEWVGADPIEPLGSVAEQLGPAAARVRAIGFTHLHSDHTDGIASLCAATDRRLKVVQAPLQTARSNYTTRAGVADLERAGCVVLEQLEVGPLYAVPGFPGLGVMQAGGHTPGSQLFVAHVRTDVRTEGEVQSWLFTGDVVNNVDGVRHNVPKPWLYSLLVVPEAPARLDRVRRFLARLEQEAGIQLLVSHDQVQLEQSGVAVWAPPGAAP